MKKFIKTILNKSVEAFIVHMTSFNLSLILIHLAKKAQIILLFTKKVTIYNKYSDFSNNFLKKKLLILLKISNLN